jgi:hypothetical protein
MMIYEVWVVDAVFPILPLDTVDSSQNKLIRAFKMCFIYIKGVTAFDVQRNRKTIRTRGLKADPKSIVTYLKGQDDKVPVPNFSAVQDSEFAVFFFFPHILISLFLL